MRFDLQKASLSKRIPAWLLDTILLVVLVTAFAALLSTAFGYDNYNTQLKTAREKYEAEYNIDFEITQEDWEKLTGEEQELYEKQSDEALKALNADKEAVHAFNMVLSLSFAIPTLSILLAYLLLEFAVPLLFGNGQTLGKKVFNIALMRTDGVKVTTFMMFVRTILGKYTLETMIPVLIVLMLIFQMIGLTGTLVLVLFLLLQLGLLLFNRTRSVLHDLIACTVAVDNASQMMLDTPEALLDYQKRVSAERALHSDY